MPCRPDPFTYDHKEHAIAHHDDCSVGCFADHDRADDVDFDAVRELLDARALKFAAPKQYLRVVDSFDQRDRLAAQRIAWAIDLSADLAAHLADLSRNERAEFDRRTT